MNVILEIFSIAMIFVGAIITVHQYRKLKYDRGDLSGITTAGMVIGAAITAAFTLISIRLYLEGLS
jgi:drug/metabolite transporter (DMT)-like permease